MNCCWVVILFTIVCATSCQMNMAFDAKNFMHDLEGDPTVDRVNALKKSELLCVCKHLNLEVKTAMKKAEVKVVLLEYLVDENVLSDSVLENVQIVTSSDFEMKKLELEFDLKRRETELQAQLSLRQLELESERLKSAQVFSKEFDVSKHIKLVPQFNERDVDKFFMHFEKIAQQCKWPSNVWTLMLQSVLKGKAQEVYSALSIEQSSQYDFVKQEVLKAYELVPEAYRQQFRGCRKSNEQTYVEFARDKAILFDRWCCSKDVKSFEQLKELVLVEEFKRCVHADIRTHLDEQHVDTLAKASTMADDYSLTHKKLMNRNVPHQTRMSPARQKAGTDKPESSSVTSKPTYKKTCSYCKKQGHVKDECWFLQKKENKSKTVALTAQLLPLKKTEDVSEDFKSFVSDGSVSASQDDARHQVKILRDTAAAQSLMIADALPLTENTSLNETVLTKGIGGYVNVPLHRIHLNSELVSGSVIVGVVSDLPVDGVSLLLGNDLAGERVKVSDEPRLTANPDPAADSGTEELEEEFPELFPACVVTRAMKQKEGSSDNDSASHDLSDTFMNKLENLVTLQVDVQGHDSGESQAPHADAETPMGRQHLIQEQTRDAELASLLERALPADAINQTAVCYYTNKNGVLMRKWRPVDASADEWNEVHQIVVPKKFRTEILTLSHDAPVGGHLGVRKTLDRIQRHFYWPSIKRDVTEYCKTCHVCQVVGKPNSKIPAAPLKPIPVMEEPFARIIIDCVGPLPKTKSGHEYLLTIMDSATRFPEAIPLRRITSQAVIKALVKFFTLFGLPKMVQSDQGSNFTSRVFKQVMTELGIQHHMSSAFHPESQGALERYHQTLKNMMRTYCLQHKKDWDEGVPLLLFATREVVQESLGFSPFDLVFAHSVRGPLKLLKDQWLEDDNSSDILTFVSTFRERLHGARQFAKENLKAAQISMKTWFDRKAKERKISVGDKVLAMLPVPGDSLKARFYGPYVVSRKVSELDYEIETPERRKGKQLCHINMLKLYHDRTPETATKPVVANVSARVSADNQTGAMYNDVESVTDNTENDNLTSGAKMQNSNVMTNLDKKLDHLSDAQRQELSDLIKEYSQLFGDVPTQTHVMYHDVDVGEARPVKQHPYRMNPIKTEIMSREVKYLVENELVEGSHSEWSSPCLLVPKPNSTYRFCTDYRKVNAVTKTDSYPIPRMEDCIDKVGSAKYVSKLDLLKGYWQVPLTPKAVEVSAFVTPDGLYQYKVMPFGMKNASATFQRLMNEVIFELEGCDVYIDDLIIFSETWEQHVVRLRALFERLSKANLTVNLLKSEFGHAHITYLGHVVGQGTVKPVDAKVECILKIPRPTNKREVMRFLGSAGYYRRFCRNFSDIVTPLSNLLRKNVKFVWNDECQRAFEAVKAILSNSPVLMTPNFEKDFILTVDASDIGAGAVLQQESGDGIVHPVCYFSQKFNQHQRNYSTIEKEALSLVLAINHFDVYLCTSNEILVYTDHNPLIFINKMKNKNQRILRWALYLQAYNIELRHIRGKDNVVADHLSRVV